VIFIVSNTFWSPPDGQMLSYVASKGALIGMTRPRRSPGRRSPLTAAWSCGEHRRGQACIRAGRGPGGLSAGSLTGPGAARNLNDWEKC
jgi:hypothetical protein